MGHGARILLGAIAMVLWIGACDEPTKVAVGDDEGADSVVVSPSTAILDEPGQTRQFTATAYEDEQPLPAPDVTWASTDFAVATVGQDGVAVAQGTGETFIVAAVDEAADSATLSVDFAANPGS